MIADIAAGHPEPLGSCARSSDAFDLKENHQVLAAYVTLGDDAHVEPLTTRTGGRDDVTLSMASRSHAANPVSMPTSGRPVLVLRVRYAL
jgi:hypothetical protein